MRELSLSGGKERLRKGAQSFSDGAVKKGRLWTVTGVVLSVATGGMLDYGSLAVVAGWLVVAAAWLAVVACGNLMEGC